LLLGRIWSAPAERSGDGALDNQQVLRPRSKFSRAVFAGAMFSVAFILALAPWTIRNWRTLPVFEPLAPTHANMPGEFVPLGYHRWLKTWMTDAEYLDQLMWDLGKEPVDVDELPDSAFDSQAEHDRIAELFDKLNGPDTESDQSDADEQDEASKDQATTPGELTPEIDAGFAQIANERIARHPFRYYVMLPLRRAHALWFNTHSDFYPFTGNALPLNNPENNRSENFWLPIFAVLVGIYTVLGVGGLVLLAMNGGLDERVWVLLVALIFITRLALFSMAVSVEPRYVVEFFPILAATGAIAIMNFKEWFKRKKPSEA
jgi:hypothetical protein